MPECVTATIGGRAIALLAILWIASIAAAKDDPAPRDRKAPVEDGKKVDAKNQHDRADGADGADWSMMKAWNKGASNLSQTGHLVRPAGQSIRVSGRVFNLVLAQGGKFLVAKTNAGLAVVDADKFEVVKQYTLGGERGSMHGLAANREGNTIYCTGNRCSLYTASIDPQGKLTLGAPIDLSAGKKTAGPLGIALSPDEKTAVVALSITNEAAVVDLAAGKVVARIPVGVCPYGVVVGLDGKTALVGNFGGSRAKAGDTTAKSAGADVAVDDRGVALRGTVSIIDLPSRKVVAEITTRIHPEAMALSADGKLAYVVDASGDGISVIDMARREVIRQLCTRPAVELAYGSLTNALAVSPDGKTLLAANAGNNAVAMIDMAEGKPAGFIAAGGFPGAVCLRGNDLFIGNVYGYFGGLQKVALPAAPEDRAKMTRDAEHGFHLTEVVRAHARAESGVPPRPIPARPGEPSKIKHVVYIIKENKKFDQVLGDMGRGNCDPKLCEFPRALSPNTHALADQFVLLDNYYCSGVLSCDGHQWAVQGLTSPYREKDWDNTRCTYDFGVDPLCYAGCGFIWDHLLRRGVSFRNFGELDSPTKTPNTTWIDFYRSWKNKDGKARFQCKYAIESLRRYSDLRFPGWEMAIPDQVRADAFLNALGEFERAGSMPEFVIIYLPNDHTCGATRRCPTPRAYVADNDLALGRVIEGLSKSRFWNDMAVFVNEDDPQTGADHVDGHRSICLVAGPYVKRGGTVVSRFYNQSSVLHTICRIFGVPPMNQVVAMAPVMEDCFQDAPDFTPYRCLPVATPLDEMNDDILKRTLKKQAGLIRSLEKIDFSGPDRIDEEAEALSRYVWWTVRGDKPFPIEFFGAHGKGLKALGLRLAPDDDD